MVGRQLIVTCTHVSQKHRLIGLKDQALCVAIWYPYSEGSRGAADQLLGKANVLEMTPQRLFRLRQRLCTILMRRHPTAELAARRRMPDKGPSP